MRQLWNSLNSQYVKGMVKLLKYSLQISLHSSRIFSVAIFTDNKKLNKAQERLRLCQSCLPFSIPGVISKERRQQNSMRNMYQYQSCQPLLTCFFLRVFSLKYFNSKQRTLLLACDAESVKSRISTDNDFFKKTH